MKMKSKLIAAVVCLIVAAPTSLPFMLHAQSARPSGGVLIFIHPPWDHPLSDVGDKDFILRQGNRQISVTLRRPSGKDRNSSATNIPTNVLVILDPRAASLFGDQQAFLHKLEPIWKQGFQVSVQLPGVAASPFVSSIQQAQSNLQGNASVSDQTAESIRAINDLGSLNGRRAILYVIGTSGVAAEKVPHKFVEMANDIMAQLYVVDGGRPSGSFDYFGLITHVRGTQPWSPPAINELGFDPKISYPAENLYSLGVYHEIDLKTAENTLINDSNNYFDLAVQCITVRCIDFRSPVVLQIQRQGPMRVVSQAYGDLSRVALEVKAE